MLLRHTTKDIKERTGLVVNPIKMCQPIGAMYASLGIHGCMPHSHGSQGCCSYHRSTLSRHFKEPVIASTSSFTEGSSVFGGQANLLEAITNVFTIYNPDCIAIHTTCLSETIGDDVAQIINKAKEEGRVPANKFVIHTNTPSYIGSHIYGFANMVKSMVRYFAGQKIVANNKINIIPGWCEPADMKEIKHVAREMNIDFIMFPDTSDVLDSPQTGKYEMYPKGGVTINELKNIGNSIITLAMGHFSSMPAALELDSKYKVKFEELDIPIGIKATDRFVNAMSLVTGKPVPLAITEERGRVIDMITDMEQYFYNKKVALFGDPDQVIPLCEFLVDLGMSPIYVITGTPGKYFEDRLSKILKDIPNAKFKQSADLFLLHQWIKNEKVDLLIGNTYGKYIARDENIPFIHFGFPIFDRIGHQYFPSVCYKGAMRLLEKILDTILTKKDNEVPEEAFELIM